jgi:hypothetical protein
MKSATRRGVRNASHIHSLIEERLRGRCTAIQLVYDLNLREVRMKNFLAVMTMVLLGACGEGEKPAADDKKLPSISDSAKREQAEAAMTDMAARQKKLADSAAKWGKEEPKK